MPELLIDRQRLCLSRAAIEREHQLRAQALAQRVSLHQSRQLANELVVVSEREIRLDTLLQGAEMKLLQLRDRRLRKRRVGEVRKRRSAPQRQPSAHDPRRVPGRARRQRLAPLLDQAAEAVKVKLARRDAKQVPMPAGNQHPT